MKRLDVTIWDASVERIREMEKNLHAAAADEDIALHITIMSERPLLGRKNMLARMPVLEMENLQWTLHPHKACTVEECRALLHKVLLSKRGKGTSG